MASSGKGARKTAKNQEYRALAAFRYHIRRYLDLSDRTARSEGIEPKQYQLLLAIRGIPDDSEPTVGNLAQQLHLRHHSAVELVNRAEANDLVERSRSGTYVRVRLTRKGQRVLEKVVEKRLKDLRVAGPVLVSALQDLLEQDR